MIIEEAEKYSDSLDEAQVVAIKMVSDRVESEKINSLRHNNNDTGRCLECDLPIPEGRLKLVTNARYCVEHEEQFDKKSRQFRQKTAV